MAMRKSCIHFEERFYIHKIEHLCKLGLAPDSPKKCPPNCSRFERFQVKKKSASTKSIVDQLNTLAKLRKSGDITEAEFQALKSRLMSESSGGAKADSPQPYNGSYWEEFIKRGRKSNEATNRLLGQPKNAPEPRDAAKPRKSDAKPKSRQPISVGDEVVHDALGSGVVVASDRSGRLSSLTVKFDRGVTVKKVLAVHLRRVG